MQETQSVKRSLADHIRSHIEAVRLTIPLLEHGREVHKAFFSRNAKAADDAKNRAWAATRVGH